MRCHPIYVVCLLLQHGCVTKEILSVDSWSKESMVLVVEKLMTQIIIEV